MVDEGPGPEDLARFGAETAHCPDCGAEIWDQADICPECRAWLGDGTARHAPDEAWWRQRWVAVTAIVTLVGFLALVLSLRLF
ncbi:MAG: hypothetical protein ACYTG1_01575 [Planctomycetota bacterium]